MGLPALGLIFLLPCLLSAQGAFYGSGVQADSLANTTLGPGGNQVSCRFRAAPGGILEGVRPFLIWSFRKAGYHGGTGGILRVEVQEDDGTPAHLPSGKVLAANIQRLFIVPASDQFYPLITFDRRPALRAGALYHVVFTNLHPRCDENYLSINALFTREATAPVQPTRADADWAMLLRNDRHPAWSPRRTPGTREGFTPILEIDYANGASQGLGYMEVWMGAGRPIGGSAQVGEVFTVGAADRRAGKVAVRIRRLAGAGPLAVRVESLDGRRIGEGTCDGKGLAPSPSCSLGGCGWVRADFAQPLVLQRGRSYRLVLAASGGDRFEAFPVRKGSDKGFSDPTLFPDGHAEFNDGKGWRGWEQWGRAPREDSDLQFFFDMK